MAHQMTADAPSPDTSPYEIITFDCYGTLIDWEAGTADAFLRAAREDGIDLKRDNVLREYATLEPVVERERFRFRPLR